MEQTGRKYLVLVQRTAKIFTLIAPFEEDMTGNYDDIIEEPQDILEEHVNNTIRMMMTRTMKLFIFNNKKKSKYFDLKSKFCHFA